MNFSDSSLQLSSNFVSNSDNSTFYCPCCELEDIVFNHTAGVITKKRFVPMIEMGETWTGEIHLQCQLGKHDGYYQSRFFGKGYVFSRTSRTSFYNKIIFSSFIFLLFILLISKLPDKVPSKPIKHSIEQIKLEGNSDETVH